MSNSQTPPTNSHKTVYLITLKSDFLLNTFVAERDAISARMKSSRRGSHMAAHASVTSLIGLL